MGWLSDFFDVVEAAEVGYEIGTDLNELGAERLIDEIGDNPGSGPLGEYYLETINEYGDPMDLVD